MNYIIASSPLARDESSKAGSRMYRFASKNDGEFRSQIKSTIENWDTSAEGSSLPESVLEPVLVPGVSSIVLVFDPKTDCLSQQGLLRTCAGIRPEDDIVLAPHSKAQSSCVLDCDLQKHGSRRSHSRLGKSGQRLSCGALLSYCFVDGLCLQLFDLCQL